jgi:hypothetical protein
MKRPSIYLLAAPLAATITLAFLSGRSLSGGRSGAAKPEATAKHGVAVNAISPHLPFGNPSNAGSDLDNKLVLRQQFAALWNAKKRIANFM